MKKDKYAVMTMTMKAIDNHLVDYKEKRRVVTHVACNFLRAACRPVHEETITSMEKVAHKYHDKVLDMAGQVARQAANTVVDQGMDMLEEIEKDLDAIPGRKELLANIKEIANR